MGYLANQFGELLNQNLLYNYPKTLFTKRYYHAKHIQKQVSFPPLDWD